MEKNAEEEQQEQEQEQYFKDVEARACSRLKIRSTGLTVFKN